MLLGAVGWGEWRVIFNGYRDPVWDYEKVIELDGGDSCTTL